MEEHRHLLRCDCQSHLMQFFVVLSASKQNISPSTLGGKSPWNRGIDHRSLSSWNPWPSWLEEPPNMDHMGYEFQLLVILNPINRSNVPYFIPSTIPDPHWPLRPRPWAVTAWAKCWRAWAKVDDLGVSLVYETSICMYIYIYTYVYTYNIIYIYIQATAKTPAILNMYWTDIGSWKLLEIVKNTR